MTAGSLKFAALRNRDCRPYLFGAALAMMADNVEHVMLGAAVGIHWSLGLSAAVLCVGTALAGVYALRGAVSARRAPSVR